METPEAQAQAAQMSAFMSVRRPLRQKRARICAEATRCDVRSSHA